MMLPNLPARQCKLRCEKITLLVATDILKQEIAIVMVLPRVAA
jgi:hypothetical protein